VQFITKLKIAERSLSQVVPHNAVGLRPDFLAKVHIPDVDDTANATENIPFTRKYWYYILPIVFALVFGALGADEDKGNKKRRPEPGASSSGNK
jgi:hypothetical protein